MQSALGMDLQTGAVLGFCELVLQGAHRDNKRIDLHLQVIVSNAQPSSVLIDLHAHPLPLPLPASDLDLALFELGQLGFLLSPLDSVAV